MSVRDRVVELRRVPAASLKANPLNWRTHTVQQAEVLRALLGEVGYVGALVARELADGTLQLIDGHLRAETTPTETVPVLVVDLNDDEAAKVLATFDPLSQLAGRDEPAWQSLLSELDSDNPVLASWLDELSRSAEQGSDSVSGDRNGNSSGGRSGSDVTDGSGDREAAGDVANRDETRGDAEGAEQWLVIVQCDHEEHQRDLLSRLQAEGLRCRALMN